MLNWRAKQESQVQRHSNRTSTERNKRASKTRICSTVHAYLLVVFIYSGGILEEIWITNLELHRRKLKGATENVCKRLEFTLAPNQIMLLKQHAKKWSQIWQLSVWLEFSTFFRACGFVAFVIQSIPSILFLNCSFMVSMICVTCKIQFRVKTRWKLARARGVLCTTQQTGLSRRERWTNSRSFQWTSVERGEHYLSFAVMHEILFDEERGDSETHAVVHHLETEFPPLHRMTLGTWNTNRTN